MSTETSMILFWLVLIQEGAGMKPVMTFTPNYRKIFRTESITMSCDVGSTTGEGLKYHWYQGRYHRGFKNYHIIQNAETSQSGNYQCGTLSGVRSDPVTLDVSDGYVILQTPLYVYEGDDIRLRCHHYPGNTGGQTIFYKDNKVIRDWGNDEEFLIENVDMSTAGRYKCGKVVYFLSSYTYEDEVSVTVQELFTTPTINVTQQPVSTKNMTLKCETSLHPSRQDTQVRFAFYREGQVVQGFGVNDIYEVYDIQLKDSGKYSCDVETTDGKVRKRSAEQIIQIWERFSHPNITVTQELLEGDPMTLTCDTTISPYINRAEVHFAFYRDGRTVQGFRSSNKYILHSAHLEDSGNYTCEVKTPIHTTMRRSDVFHIQIQELIVTPTITVTPHLMSVGENMTITCQTSLHPSRQETQLRFAFYTEGRVVQEFGFSDIYEVYFVPLEASGKHSCEVLTLDGKVRKRSAEQIIQISGPTENIGYSQQNILRLTLSAVICIMAALFVFYHIKWIQSMKPVDDSTT